MKKTKEINRGALKGGKKQLLEKPRQKGVGKVYEIIRPESSEDVKDTDPYIDKNTLLIIPEHLRKRAPFFILTQGKSEVSLKDLSKLSGNQCTTAIRMLAGLRIKIKNGDTILKIELQEILSLPTGKGSLHNYLLMPHLIIPYKN